MCLNDRPHVLSNGVCHDCLGILAHQEAGQKTQVLPDECLLQILLMLGISNGRSLAASVKAALDEIALPVFSGPPPLLPSMVSFRETVSWAYSEDIGQYPSIFRYIDLETRCKDSTHQTVSCWANTSTTLIVRYGQVGVPGPGEFSQASLDPDTSCEFWKAVHRQLRNPRPKETIDIPGVCPMSQTSLDIQYGEGKNHVLTAIGTELKQWFVHLETCVETPPAPARQMIFPGCEGG